MNEGTKESVLKASQLPANAEEPPDETVSIDPAAMFKLSYGLFVLTAKDGHKDNGCIINTVLQVTASPMRIVIAVNKSNFTTGMIIRTGSFNVSILTESTPFSIFEQFGFSSGKGSDKFEKCGYDTRTINGIRYIPHHTNGVLSATVAGSYDCGTHIMFIADIAETLIFSNEPSMTYRYYFDHVKPKPQSSPKARKGFVCKICGYFLESDTLPADFVCPLCNHGAQDFESL